MDNENIEKVFKDIENDVTQRLNQMNNTNKSEEIICNESVDAIEKAIKDIQLVTGVKHSEEQLRVLRHRLGMCILACAGAGKTTVLTQLLALRIMTGQIKNASKVLCTTYSKAGQITMQERIEELFKKLGIRETIEVKTMHAVYLKVLKHFGFNFKVIDGATRIEYIREACRDIQVKLNDEDMKTLESLLSYQINNIMGDSDLVNSYVFTLKNLSLTEYSAIRKLYNTKKQQNGLIDFDDMQLYMYVWLVQNKNESVIEYCRNLWTDFYIDEAQDLSKIQFEILRQIITDPNKLVLIGDDDQCLIEGTLVDTNRGKIPIEDIQGGDLIKSAIGGGNTTYVMPDNISKKKISENIVVVKTKSGKELKGTSNHIGFARIEPKEEVYYTYLMYKRDVGFRIGVTSGVRSGARQSVRSGIDVRLMQEKADKIWIIKVSKTKEESLYWESLYAYKYGIPMYRFVANEDGSAKTELSADTIVELHNKLDTYTKGLNMLNDIGMSFEYPHRIPQATGERYKLNFSMFSSSQINSYRIHKSELSANTSDEKFTEILEQYMVVSDRKATSSEYRYKSARNTTYAIDTQEEIIKRITDDCAEKGIYLEVNKNAKFNDNKYMFMPLGNMVKGMYIPILVDGKIEEDEIVSVEAEKYEGYVYDISIPDTRNFIANDIVVHNCIYQWRGADPSIILNICGYYDIQQFVLSTNYRCSSNIVDRAAVSIKNCTHRAEKTMQAFNKGGVVKVCDTGGSDLFNQSKYAFIHIRNLIESGVKPSDIAVLSRNNQHLAILNNMLFMDGIYCTTPVDMKFTQSQMYRDIKTVVELGANSRNSTITSNNLWKVCVFLGLKGSKFLGNFQATAGLKLSDAIGFGLNTYTRRKVDWNGNVSVPPTADMKMEAFFNSLKDGTLNYLEMVYKFLIEEDEKKRVCGLLTLYLSATEFMYKDKDRARSVDGMVAYTIYLVEKLGVNKLKAFFRTSEQYESGKMYIPGDKVVMSTMHSSKGMEWKYVVMFAVDNVTFPSFSNIRTMGENGVSLKDISLSIDEERRLYYVSSTRAAENLTIFTNADDMSIFALEAFELYKPKEGTSNSHIISMANVDSLHPVLKVRIKQFINDESLPTYYKIDVSDFKSKNEFMFIEEESTSSGMSLDSIQTGRLE